MKSVEQGRVTWTVSVEIFALLVYCHKLDSRGPVKSFLSISTSLVRFSVDTKRVLCTLQVLISRYGQSLVCNLSIKCDKTIQ